MSAAGSRRASDRRAPRSRSRPRPEPELARADQQELRGERHADLERRLASTRSYAAASALPDARDVARQPVRYSRSAGAGTARRRPRATSSARGAHAACSLGG